MTRPATLPAGPLRALTPSEIDTVAGGCPLLVAVAVAIAIMAVARTAE